MINYYLTQLFLLACFINIKGDIINDSSKNHQKKLF
jgi:hypothetical protein